jgi:hypothetical protein
MMSLLLMLQADEMIYFQIKHSSQKLCTVILSTGFVLTSESDWKVIWIVECEDLLVSVLIFKIEGDR